VTPAGGREPDLAILIAAGYRALTERLAARNRSGHE
jgi:deoxyadenosine/deoxycytidine kinase